MAYSAAIDSNHTVLHTFPVLYIISMGLSWYTGISTTNFVLSSFVDENTRAHKHPRNLWVIMVDIKITTSC